MGMMKSSSGFGGGEYNTCSSRVVDVNGQALAKHIPGYIVNGRDSWISFVFYSNFNLNLTFALHPFRSRSHHIEH